MSSSLFPHTKKVLSTANPVAHVLQSLLSYKLPEILTIWGNYVCKILGFHGGDYEECRRLGCGAV
jgi:hypothetical protein